AVQAAALQVRGEGEPRARVAGDRADAGLRLQDREGERAARDPDPDAAAGDADDEALRPVRRVAVVGQQLEPERRQRRLVQVGSARRAADRRRVRARDGREGAWAGDVDVDVLLLEAEGDGGGDELGDAD